MLSYPFVPTSSQKGVLSFETPDTNLSKTLCILKIFCGVQTREN